jgi:hypothetical protein
VLVAIGLGNQPRFMRRNHIFSILGQNMLIPTAIVLVADNVAEMLVEF